MELQPTSCVAIYAAACLCLQPSDTVEMARVLKSHYQARLLENPEAVCQLRRILRCPVWQDVLQKRPNLHAGIKDCLSTEKERFHFGFAMRVFHKVSRELTVPFALMKELWGSFRKVVELGGGTDAEAEEEARKTLEDVGKLFRWDMRQVDLAKELQDAPFFQSHLLVEKLGFCWTIER